MVWDSGWGSDPVLVLKKKAQYIPLFGLIILQCWSNFCMRGWKWTVFCLLLSAGVHCSPANPLLSSCPTVPNFSPELLLSMKHLSDSKEQVHNIAFPWAVTHRVKADHPPKHFLPNLDRKISATWSRQDSSTKMVTYLFAISSHVYTSYCLQASWIFK